MSVDDSQQLGFYPDLASIKAQIRQMQCLQGVELILRGLTFSPKINAGYDQQIALVEEDLLLRVMQNHSSLGLRYPSGLRDVYLGSLKGVVADVFLRCLRTIGLYSSSVFDSVSNLNLELTRAVLDYCSKWAEGKGIAPELREVLRKLLKDTSLWDAGLKDTCARGLYMDRDFKTLGQNRLVEAAGLVYEDIRSFIWRGEGERSLLEGPIEKILSHLEGKNQLYHECAYLRMCLAIPKGRQLLREAGAKLEITEA